MFWNAVQSIFSPVDNRSEVNFKNSYLKCMAWLLLLRNMKKALFFLVCFVYKYIGGSNKKKAYKTHSLWNLLKWSVYFIPQECFSPFSLVSIEKVILQHEFLFVIKSIILLACVLLKKCDCGLHCKSFSSVLFQTGFGTRDGWCMVLPFLQVCSYWWYC